MNKKNIYCPLCSGKFESKVIEPDETLRLVCKECGYTHFQNPTPTVLAIIEKGDQLLLVKRKYDPYKGEWDIPGGFLEVGQNLEDAIKAEIKEELGVGVKSATYFKSTVSFYQTKYKVENIVGAAFKVEVDSYDFVPGSDVLEVKFFDINDLPPIAPLKDVVESVIKLIKEKKNEK